MRIHRALAVAALATGAVVGVGAPALAATEPAYPPATPAPSVTQVLPSSAVLGTKVTARDAAAEPEVAVLGIKITALPRTGSEIATVAGLGALLVGGGIGAVRLSRRTSGSHR